MPTHGADHGGVGSAAKEVAEHASAIARLELELASLELKRKLGSLGVGIGLAVAAAVLGLFGLGLGFGLAAGAAGLATLFDTWVAILIVCGGLLVVALLLLMVGLGAIRKGTPPVPEQAIREAKLTTEALRSDGG